MAKNDSKKQIEAKAKGILGTWIVRNLLLAALLVVGLLLFAQVGLGLITRHNRTVTVPDFTNLINLEIFSKFFLEFFDRTVRLHKHPLNSPSEGGLRTYPPMGWV